jgi:hypothetical protein
MGLLLTATPAVYAAAPRWQVSSLAKPTDFTPLDLTGDDSYEITLTNVGDAATSGNITITDVLPPKLTAKRVEFFAYGKKGTFRSTGADFGPSLCTTAPVVSCTYEPDFFYPVTGHGTQPLGDLPHGEELLMRVSTEVHAAKPAALTNAVTVSGGGAAEASASSTNQVTAAGSAAPFGIGDLELSDFASDGNPSTQAGAHPYELTTTIAFNNEAGAQAINGEIPYFPTGDPRDIVTELPPGLVGNPRAVPPCSIAQFTVAKCPLDTQVGGAVIALNTNERLFRRAFNVAPQSGNVAVIGLEEEFGPKVLLTPTLRTGGDYGLRITAINTPQLWVEYVKVTIWGVPADPSHDFWRGRHCGNLGCNPGSGNNSSDAQPPVPFLTNPTACSGAQLPASVSANSWEDFSAHVAAATTWPALVGCNQLNFEPALEARPTTNLADSPSGLDVDLHFPLKGLEEPEALSEADLKDTTVTLPPGFLVNPASANGLSACTTAQFGLTSTPGATPLTATEGPATCPEAAKLGTVAVDTPLLDHPLPGAVYLAQPYENPFGSLLALYVAIDDPQTGVVVKLAGKVTPDPATGQLTTTFSESPQLPFEDFHVKLFGGAQGALRTPPTCGPYKSSSVLTPWSAPESGAPVEPGDEFQITGSASGAGACPASAGQQPNAPAFHAGTEAPQAGAFSPFALKLAREDGSQELAKIDTTLPPGLVGKLAGVGECPRAALAAAADPNHTGAAEQASPSCPASSEVGTVDVATGAGPTPLKVSGHAYLAGPYKGAPLSLAIITPAVAGPFDLGTVVVRTALYVNPETAQITAVSDVIPHILQGLPLDVRSIALKMSRPDFTLNPTNCNEFGFSGQALTVFGQSASLAQRFQAANCAKLAFKPILALRLKGAVRRTANPELIASLTMRPGEANVASAQVKLPPSAFLDNAHIGTVCTRVQFAAGAQLGAGCPAGSVYGRAKAISPLLDKPLEGNVYLRSSSNKLPDLVAALNGQIEVALVGKTDSVKGALRNTFEAVPDAPVSSFRLELFGGKRGLIQMSSGFCAHPEATVNFVGQNGKAVENNPKVRATCPKKKGKKGPHKHHRGHR